MSNKEAKHYFWFIFALKLAYDVAFILWDTFSMQYIYGKAFRWCNLYYLRYRSHFFCDFFFKSGY